MKHDSHVFRGDRKFPPRTLRFPPRTRRFPPPGFWRGLRFWEWSASYHGSTSFLPIDGYHALQCVHLCVQACSWPNDIPLAMPSTRMRAGSRYHGFPFPLRTRLSWPMTARVIMDTSFQACMPVSRAFLVAPQTCILSRVMDCQNHASGSCSLRDCVTFKPMTNLPRMHACTDFRTHTTPAAPCTDGARSNFACAD